MTQDITQILQRVRDGDSESIGLVFQSLYDELHKIAASRLRGASNTLTPTVLIHEAFERFAGARQLSLVDRRHFYACAARATLMIIIDHARRAIAGKRKLDPLSITASDFSSDTIDALDLDRALSELGEINDRAREVVSLRFLLGLTMQETADVLEVSLRTANREWEKARAFLNMRLRETEHGKHH